MTLYYIVCGKSDMVAAYDGVTVFYKLIGKENRKKAFRYLHSIPVNTIASWETVTGVSDFGVWLGSRDYIEYINVLG